jgi:hypothetical protein
MPSPVPSLSDIAKPLETQSDVENAAAFLEAVQTWLAQDLDWSSIVADHLQSMSEDDFCAHALRGAIADSVPRVILLHECCGGEVQIVLHHFERPLWLAHFKQGRFRPHHHSRPFAARLLSGGYHHLTYRAEKDSVKLTPVHETECRTGDLYGLSCGTYHFVALPEHNTLTLSVRGRVEEELDISADERFNRETLLALRENLVSLLEATAQQIPLRRWNFEAMAHANESLVRE